MYELFQLPLKHIYVSGAQINNIKKNYLESQSRRSSRLKGLGEELQGVQKVMFENIDAVLQRGELITGQSWLW